MGWQVSAGTGGSFRPESVAVFTGMRGSFRPEYTFKGCESFKLGQATLKYDTTFHICGIDASEQQLKIKLCFDPKGRPETFNDTLIIESNLYSKNVWQIPISGKAEDLTPPTITDDTICDVLRPGNPLTVSASATDGCNLPPSLMLYYRILGGAEHPLPFDNGNAVIPADSITKRGIEYRIIATDASGKDSWEPAQGYHSMPVRVEAPADLIWLGTRERQQSYFPLDAMVNSYRMISVPLNLDDKKAETVIVNDLPDYDNGVTWLLYDYFNGNYCEYTPQTKAKFREFIPGRAFWLITTQLPETLQVGPGKSVTTSAESATRCNIVDYSRYTLEPGWNLIGNPYPFDIATAACSFASGDSITNIWQYDIPTGQSVGDWIYKPAVLKPWQGYAIRALKATDLIFSNREARASSSTALSQYKPETTNSTQDWHLQIQARGGQHLDLDNYAGIREHARTDWDAADIFEPPPIGEYIAVYFPHRDWPEYPSDYAGDFRPAFANGEVWEFEVKSNLKESAITLTIKTGVNFPSHLSVYLYDKNRQAFQDLREHADYTFNNLGELLPGRFELLIGTMDFVQHRTTAITNNLPDEIQLYQNFPNPFNQETIFSFYLPQAAPVTLKVFDVLGREVRVLSDSRVWEKGRQFVRWAGEDHSGNKVANGFYILSLQAGGFMWQQQIMLLK